MSTYAKIKNIIERNDTKAGDIFDIVIQALIIVSVISFSIETIPGLPTSAIHYLAIIEVISVILFTVEYIFRIIVADKPLKFIFSFLGIIDLIAILPFYIASGIDLRSVRIFRLFRLIRVFKLFRYSKAAKRYKQAFAIIRHELMIFLAASTFLLYLASVGIYYFESPSQPEQFKSVFHCMWWAVTTLTTIGSGTIYPITAGGKIFTALVVFIGLGLIAVPTGLFASALTRCIQVEDERIRIKVDDKVGNNENL